MSKVKASQGQVAQESLSRLKMCGVSLAPQIIVDLAQILFMLNAMHDNLDGTSEIAEELALRRQLRAVSSAILEAKQLFIGARLIWRDAIEEGR